MKSFVKAYLDDYQKITVVINRSFCGGHSDVFYLIYQDEYWPLTVESSEELEDKIIYRVVTDRKLNIGEEYEVMIVNACKIHLEYRFIVKTSQFNREFYYDGEDLGCHEEERYTCFAFWAPTASQVKIELEQNGSTKILSMQKTDKGVWRIRITPSLTGSVYRYLVRINGEWSYCTDPYARCSLANSEKSFICGCDDTGREDFSLPPFSRYSEAIIYEACIRDLSAEGTFKAAMPYLNYLQELGITHLQLMPVNDFGSVDELHPKLFYNWGYDPVQFQVLEGSYSSNVNDPCQVRRDFSALVNEAHRRGIRINLDVVFNHVHVQENSSFHLSVPYYYFRYHADGRLSDGSGCGNDIDTEMLMARKYILDTMKYYVSTFGVDGFRFDLMGLIDIETIKEAYRQLHEIKPDIMMYGEGWNMNTAMAYENRACKDHSGRMPEVAFFNDDFRDSIKGSTFDPGIKGYGTGDVRKITDAIRVFEGRTFSSLQQSVNYVECHDDMTCFDKLHFCCRNEGEKAIIDRQKLLLGCVLLAQGIPFIHAGQEYCRSKRGYSNTYNKSDDINKLKPEDRQKHADVIEYVRKMISLRKQLNLSTRPMKCFASGNILLYESADGQLTIAVNPTDEKIRYGFEGTLRERDTAELYLSSILLDPISITVLEKVQ